MERLPAHGYYKSALAMDEEWAARIVELEEQGQQVAPAADPSHMSPLDYTREVAYLSLIAERMADVRDAVIQSSGNDAPPRQPLPQPSTALDRAREGNSRSQLLQLDQYIRGGATPLD